MLEPDRLQPGRVPCNQQLPRGERRLDLNARVSQTVVRETATTTSSAECSPRRAGSPAPPEERVKGEVSLEHIDSHCKPSLIATEKMRF
ncbi:unnamed protein product [Gadus morhua 'NCC']